MAETGSSKVDYIVLVNSEPKVLVEAKSPSVMKKVSELLLSQHRVEMGSSSTSGGENSPKGEYAIPVDCDTRFKEKCVGRIVSGSEKERMALSYLPQLLDHVPSCEG